MQSTDDSPALHRGPNKLGEKPKAIRTQPIAVCSPPIAVCLPPAVHEQDVSEKGKGSALPAQSATAGATAGRKVNCSSDGGAELQRAASTGMRPSPRWSQASAASSTSPTLQKSASADKAAEAASKAAVEAETASKAAVEAEAASKAAETASKAADETETASKAAVEAEAASKAAVEAETASKAAVEAEAASKAADAHCDVASDQSAAHAEESKAAKVDRMC